MIHRLGHQEAGQCSRRSIQEAVSGGPGRPGRHGLGSPHYGFVRRLLRCPGMPRLTPPRSLSLPLLLSRWCSRFPSDPIVTRLFTRDRTVSTTSWFGSKLSIGTTGHCLQAVRFHSSTPWTQGLHWSGAPLPGRTRPTHKSPWDRAGP